MGAFGQGLLTGLLIAPLISLLVLALLIQKARMEDRQPSSRLRLVTQTAEPETSYQLLLRLARSGTAQIGSLTDEETAKVCEALLQHYAQMGIG